MKDLIREQKGDIKKPEGEKNSLCQRPMNATAD